MSDIQPTTVVGTVAQPTSSGEPSGPATQRGGAVLGAFTLRDLVIFGSVVVMLVGTVIPIMRLGGNNFWNSSRIYFLVIGIVLPLVVAGMFLVHRLNRNGALRIGSLSLDQFGSVVASFAAGYFFLLTVGEFSLGYLIAFIGALGLLASTVAAKWLPFFGGAAAVQPAVAAIAPVREKPVQEEPVDVVASTFAETPEEAQPQPFDVDSAPEPASESVQPFVVGQHFTASPVVEEQGLGEQGLEESLAEESLAEESVIEQPGVEQPLADASATFEPTAFEPTAFEPAAFEPVAEASAQTGVEPEAAPSYSDSEQYSEPESFAATVDPATRPAQDTGGQLTYEAFWFAVEKPKAVVDEHTGGFLYNIEPGIWFLALQDRGYDYLVQNSDGRIGVLRDLSGIERAPEDG